MSLAARTSRPRYAVGIDPGEHTGWAVYDRDDSKLVACEALDFWHVFVRLDPDAEPYYSTADYEFYVERIIAPLYPSRRVKARHIGRDIEATMLKMAMDAGRVTRETELLIAGLRLLGYKVNESGAAAKWARPLFERITQWPKITNQHARDAASLCWKR